jgi:hypothetical protein
MLSVLVFGKRAANRCHEGREFGAAQVDGGHD